MMAELEVDQSNLPGVQEVCQSFAVLEDGVLAHSLQEQEIEQYYTTNIQKSQLVQNDIRIAKRLQDEEEQQTQQRAFLRQASRQIEEQDFEYARVIQEELQRSAEEVWRREQDDEIIAKQMQEEEEHRIKRRGRGHEAQNKGSASESALPSLHQHTEEQCSSFTTRWRCSPSESNPYTTRPEAVSPRRLAAQKTPTSWSTQGHTNSIRHIRGDLSADSEDSDAVFHEPLSVWSQRLNERLHTACPQRCASLHYPQERNYRCRYSHSSLTFEPRTWEEARGEVPMNQERSHREGHEGWLSNRDQDRDSNLVTVSERRHSLDESVRPADRRRHSTRHLARTWSHQDNSDKRVHFQEDSRQQDESSQVWEMLGHVLRERGVPVRFGSNGVPLQILPQSRDTRVLHGSEFSCGDTRPHQRSFQRAAVARHSFHGDIRERRRSSNTENGQRDRREDQGRHYENVEHGGDEICNHANREREGSRSWRERNTNKCRVKRTTSKHRHWHKTIEERVSSEDEEQDVERKVQRTHGRAPQHSRRTRDGSRHRATEVSQHPERGESSLDLGELQQVLQDEELARKLHEEEEKLLRRNFQPCSCSSYPEGDFRVAQVAQDEEIARFMQKQEIKSKRRSGELEGPASWREHRDTISHRDRHTERRVRRERLDSEGLPSPAEDCSPENQPSSPVFPMPQAQQIRNIAEELDPTFHARRRDTENLGVGQTDPTCQSLPMLHSGVHDLEEPAFIPPTKRQTDKSGCTKPKEKKENCKQQ